MHHSSGHLLSAVLNLRLSREVAGVAAATSTKHGECPFSEGHLKFVLYEPVAHRHQEGGPGEIATATFQSNPSQKVGKS